MHDHRSLLEILKHEEITQLDLIIKKILLFLEAHYNLNTAIILREEVVWQLYYLDEMMKLSTSRLPVGDFTVTEQQTAISPDHPFQEHPFFLTENNYFQIPIQIKGENYGALFFTLEDHTHQPTGHFLKRVVLEIAFILNHIDTTTINKDAIENLLESNKELEHSQEKLSDQSKKYNLLTEENNDFGILSINRDLEMLESNPFLKKILKLDNNDNHSLYNHLSQGEIASKAFEAVLDKVTQNNQPTFTQLSLVDSKGKELLFKASIAPINEYYFIKLFNHTSETQIARRYSKLQGKFDLLLQYEADQVVNSYDLLILEIIKFFENKDEEFGHHLERIAAYSELIGTYIYEHRLFDGVIDKEYLKWLPKAAVLHDIGMLSISDAILFKDSKFTREEYEIVKGHTVVAGQVFDSMLKQFPHSKLLVLAKEIVLGHHERYDGSGYPFGLKGHQIPLSAKIIGFADMFDGLTTSRIYKKGLPLDLARMMIVNDSGKNVDPEIIEVFLKIEDQFEETFKKLEN